MQRSLEEGGKMNLIASEICFPTPEKVMASAVETLQPKSAPKAGGEQPAQSNEAAATKPGQLLLAKSHSSLCICAWKNIPGTGGTFTEHTVSV